MKVKIQANLKQGRKSGNWRNSGPKCNFMKAKRTLGINMSLQPAEISMQEVQRRFVAKNAAVGSRVSLSSSLFFLCRATSQIVEQMSGIYLQHSIEQSSIHQFIIHEGVTNFNWLFQRRSFFISCLPAHSSQIFEDNIQCASFMTLLQWFQHIPA